MLMANQAPSTPFVTPTISAASGGADAAAAVGVEWTVDEKEQIVKRGDR